MKFVSNLSRGPLNENIQHIMFGSEHVVSSKIHLDIVFMLASF